MCAGIRWLPHGSLTSASTVDWHNTFFDAKVSQLLHGEDRWSDGGRWLGALCARPCLSMVWSSLAEEVLN